jgi:hypothetical protein
VIKAIAVFAFLLSLLSHRSMAATPLEEVNRGRYEVALGTLRASVAKSDQEQLLQVWLEAMLGTAVLRTVRAGPGRLRQQTAILTALARELTLSRDGLLAKGIPALYCSAVPEDPHYLVQFWGAGGRRQQWVWDGERLVPLTASVRSMHVTMGRGGETTTRIEAPPGAWLALRTETNGTVETTVGNARWIPLEEGFHLVQSLAGTLDVTARGRAQPEPGTLVTGLVPWPRQDRPVMLSLHGSLPDMALPMSSGAVDPEEPPLLGYLAGGKALATVLSSAHRITVAGSPAAAPVARRLVPIINALLPRLHAAGANAADTVIMLSGSGSRVTAGFTRGSLICLVTDEPASDRSEEVVLAHELVHRFLLVPRHGWPAADPEEGVADFLTGLVLDAAGMTAAANALRTDQERRVAGAPPVSLERTLALEALPSPCEPTGSDRSLAYARLAVRLRALARGARAPFPGALARTLLDIWRCGTAPVELSELARDLLRLHGARLLTAN